MHGRPRRGVSLLGSDGQCPHTALFRERSSGQCMARQCMARQCVARPGPAWLLTPHPFAGAAERRGTARRGGARRGAANTQRLTGRCSLLDRAWQGSARRGTARRGKHTAAYGPLQFAGHGTAWRGEARRGVANTQRLTGRCSLAQPGEAGRGKARRGLAWQIHPANHRAVL